MTAASNLNPTLRVSDMMTPYPVTCGTSASMNAVIRAMFKYGCNALLVVDGTGRLTGVLSERDVCRAMLAHGSALLELTVKDVIGHQVFSCSPNDSLECAADLMRDLHITLLPVTDGQGRPVGVLSIDEVLPELVYSPLSHFDREAIRTFATLCDSHPH